MIDSIERKLSGFKFVTSKAEILTVLIIFHTINENHQISKDLFKNYLSVLELEPISVARSKIISDTLHVFNEFSKQDGVNNYINILLPKIEKPFFKIRAKIEKLQYFSETDNIDQIFDEIGRINEDFDEIYDVNFLITIERVINPKNFKKNSLYYIDKNSLDVTHKNYLTYVSEIASKHNSIDLIKSCFPKIEKIRLPVYRDITLRNLINNFYEIAIKNKDLSLLLEIKELSKLIKNSSYHAETLFLYTLGLKKSKKFENIIEVIDSLLMLIPKTSGEYSRAIMLQETLRIILNLETGSIKEEYLEKIIKLNEQYQGTFTAIQVNLKIIETLHEFNKIIEARDLLKKVILYSGMVTDFDLFFTIYKKTIELISLFPSLFDDETRTYFLSKIYETKNPIQRTQCLITIVNNIKFSNLILNEIKENLDSINKPFVYYNEVFTNHVFPILKFSIRHAFDNNNEEIKQNPLILIDKAQTSKERCYLYLEYIAQYKNINELEMIKRCQEELLKEITHIRNEFEKKEVVINVIRTYF